MTASKLGRIDLQIMWNRLVAVVEEQAQVLIRTAFSPIVRECGDLSAGVFDTKGRMLAQAVTGTPGHVNSMAESVRHFLAHFPAETMKPGDVYITNDPWRGTGHLNDFVVTTPAFHKGRFVGLFACTSHVTDIGGIGFGPDANDVFAEGLSIPFLKLADQGRMNETLLALVRANSRLSVEAEGDVYSLAACNDIGCKRLSEMMGEYGLDSLDELGAYILERSRAGVLAALAELPKGSWSYRMRVDGYDFPVELVARTTVSDDGIHVDYEGTSGQSRFGINVPLAYTTAYTVFGLGCVAAPDVPNNAGSLSLFTVSAPEGTILNALPPAPVSSRHLIGQMLPDVVFGCLRQAVPERVPAEGTSCLWNITLRGEARTHGSNRAAYGFAVTVTSNGGTGARPGLDGLSATAFPSGVKGTPVEVTEAIAPLVFWRKEYRPDSGGAGEHQGGHGQVIEISTANGEPMTLLAAFDRIENPARGADGGQDGAAGELTLGSGEKLRGKGFQTVPAGERLVVRTPGGAGLGDPARRAPDDVARDVRDGLVTAEAARSRYGWTG